MNVFVDANILVTVLNKEYPHYPHAARILSLTSKSGFKIYTSPLCLAIAFYFTEKKHGRSLAKKKITLLADNISITTINDVIVSEALKNKQVSDFEDGLEYYSAKASRCQCIITEDKKDFFFATNEILNTDDFVGRYMT